MKARGLPWPTASVKAGHSQMTTANCTPFTHFPPEPTLSNDGSASKGKRVPDQDISSAEQSQPAEGDEPFGRIAELARAVLRERGLTDVQIEALLRRKRVPDVLR
jgi:hypothetical protein